MATTYETTETFNEPMDKLCENLLSNLNKEGGLFHPYWEAVHMEEFTLVSQQRVRQVWAITSVPGDEQTIYIHFWVKFIELSTVGSRVDILTTSPLPKFHLIKPYTDPNIRASAHEKERRRLKKIADKVMEFCVIPNADTDVSIIGQVKRFLGRGKDKRKTDED